VSTGADRAAITCFVAMPVGRPDVNTLYDRQINRVLRQLHIRPVFMGRLEHNDNIDTRIIEEIKKCDFAIADLTYARPSVYYEAGFAERSVYVIYTCRADHFKPKADDKEGNLQVHFDLRQKNIVSWSSSGDEFREKA
jgi:nucleoside 2-deoxyribosyltransferase